MGSRPAESRIVDHRLSVRLDFRTGLQPNSHFQGVAGNEGHLSNQLLCYATLVIPTKGYGIVPVLIKWMGPDSLHEALDSKAFAFVHKDSLLAYKGGGRESQRLSFLETVLEGGHLGPLRRCGRVRRTRSKFS